MTASLFRMAPMEPGLVSIVVPTFNRAGVITETLDSLTCQSYNPIEIMIVDDGSDDDTQDVISNWVRRTKAVNCTCLRLKENSGKSVAVNEALRQAHGEYNIILDSDDVLLRDGICNLVEFLRTQLDDGMVFAKAYMIDGEKKTSTLTGAFASEDSFTDLSSKYGSLLLQGNVITASTVLVRREVIETVGPLNPKLRRAQDWEYWIRISRRFKIGFLGIPVLYYRMNSPIALSGSQFGTFIAVCAIINDARSIESKSALVRATLYQTKAHLLASYQAQNPVQMIMISLYGIWAAARLLLAGRR